MLAFFERFRKPSESSSFITRRMAKVNGRVFSVALAATMVEAAVNAFNQTNLLVPAYFWVGFLWVTAGIALSIVENYFLSGGRIGFIMHATGIIFVMLTWQWGLSGQALPDDFKPWIWWQLGMAGIGCGLFMPAALGWTLIFAMPLYWIFFRTQNFSGGPDFPRAIEDAVYSGLLAAVVTSVINLLRYYGAKADRATVSMREAQVQQASTNAVERERNRVDALVHERILATLEAAQNARSQPEQENIAAKAAEALSGLRQFASSYSSENEKISVQNLFDELVNSAKLVAPDLIISQSGEGAQQIEVEVAEAFSAATLQAIDNSIKHAGNSSVKRALHLKARRNGFKIVVEDDGCGFRPSRVPQDRIGVRKTIRNRIEVIGGEVKIDSAPGEGAKVILEWGNP